MNIEQARTVSLFDLLIKLGFKPIQANADEFKFLSPLRNEKTPSFFVNTKRNVWCDHGDGRGGGTWEFVGHFLETNGESNSPVDRLRWFRNMSGEAARIKPIDVKEIVKPQPKLKILGVREIGHPSLVEYLEDERCIPIAIARKHLKQIRVKHSLLDAQPFDALGLLNENGGYEIRKPNFKACAGRKDISFVRGTNEARTGLHIFEGMMDFLSVLADEGSEELADDAMILNSLSLLEGSTGFVNQYGYRRVWTWMDNDVAGDNALKNLDVFLKTQEGLTHYPKNSIYQNFKDVNEWWVNKAKGVIIHAPN